MREVSAGEEKWGDTEAIEGKLTEAWVMASNGQDLLPAGVSFVASLPLPSSPSQAPSLYTVLPGWPPLSPGLVPLLKA